MLNWQSSLYLLYCNDTLMERECSYQHQSWLESCQLILGRNRFLLCKSSGCWFVRKPWCASCWAAEGFDCCYVMHCYRKEEVLSFVCKNCDVLAESQCCKNKAQRPTVEWFFSISVNIPAELDSIIHSESVLHLGLNNNSLVIHFQNHPALQSLFFNLHQKGSAEEIFLFREGSRNKI